MTPERWERLKEVFQAALQRPASERASFLDEACATDPELRTEARRLLGAHDEAGSFIEKPPLAALATQAAEAPAPRIVGQRIGPYRVVAEIGRGGMGAVYRAVRDDDQYKKEVALKLVQAGADSEETLARFKQERQLLAGLDHPNIARLLDGGATEDGRPYFVMELVEGEPIDRYCDRAGLGIRRRLELFRNVCSAVQYAHQNLIVHRDIKPGNILVTREGVAKLLDFGIAKLLRTGESGGDATVTQARAMTPHYASPEQVKGEPITTASDTYSLGVLLYVLLTGRRPYAAESTTQSEVFRAICNDQPERPSAAARTGRRSTAPIATAAEGPTQDLGAPTLPAPRKAASAPDAEDVVRALHSRELRGDLDTIVLMALRKEPSRRYASVEQFSEDIRRHLAALPVIAQKDTFGYRARKFVSRNRVAVAAAALLVLSLVGGIATTLHQARIAERNGERAERRFTDVRKLANSLLFEIHDNIEHLAGATKARELLVKRAVEYLDSLSQEAGEDPSLQKELAAGYERVGAVQWSRGAASLGDTAGALASQQKALGLRATLAQASPNDVDLQTQVAVSHGLVGDALQALGKGQLALESRRRAVAIQEKLAASTDEPSVLTALAGSYSRMAASLRTTGDSAGALDHLRKALAVSEKLYASHPTFAGARRGVCVALVSLGQTLDAEGKLDEALESYRRALPLAEEAVKEDADDAQARRDASLVYTDTATSLRKKGNLDEALALYRKSLAMDEALAAADPSNLEAKRDLAVSHQKVAITLAARKDWAGAVASSARTLALMKEIAAASGGSAESLQGLANGYFMMGEALEGKGDLRGALDNERRTAEVEERMVAADPGNVDLRDSLAETYVNVAQSLAAQSDIDEALRFLGKSLSIREELVKVDANDPLLQSGLAQVHQGFADVWARAASQGSPSSRREATTSACASLEKAAALLRPLDARGVLVEVQKDALASVTTALARCPASRSAPVAPR